MLALAKIDDILDDQTLVEAFMEQRSKIYTWFRWRFSDLDSEDLTQEVIARALASTFRCTGQATVKTWLWKIVKNLAIDKWRRDAGSPFIGMDIDEVLMIRDRSLCYDFEARMSNDDLHFRIVCAMRKLFPTHREVIYYRFIMDLSLAETAAILRVSQNVIKSRQWRALARLQNFLEEQDG